MLVICGMLFEFNIYLVVAYHSFGFFFVRVQVDKNGWLDFFYYAVWISSVDLLEPLNEMNAVMLDD